MNEPILFFDVDGVLNTTGSKQLYSLSKGPLRRLEQVVKDTGCKLVLSSTWRRDAPGRAILSQTLAYRNLFWSGMTPYLPNKIRGEEIQQYLFDTNQLNATYAIVDDDSDMLGHQLPHFFQTDPDYGLTRTIAYRITYHLTHGRIQKDIGTRTSDHP